MIPSLIVVCLALLVIGLVFPYRVYRLSRWVSKWVAPKLSILLALAYPALFFLALAGLCRQAGAPLCGRSFLESARLYESMQMLLHNSSPPEHPNWVLTVVLTFAPVALILTFIPVAAGIMERVLPGLAMRRMRQHVIIFGTGDKSRQLTGDFLAEQEKARGLRRGLIVVGNDSGGDCRGFCERHSVLHTGADGNMRKTLWTDCALRNAKTLALVDDDDDRNLGVFLRVLEERAKRAVSAVLAGERLPPLEIMLHLASPDILASFDLQMLANAAVRGALEAREPSHHGNNPLANIDSCVDELHAKTKVYPYNTHRNAVLDLFEAKLFPLPEESCWLQPKAGSQLRMVIAGHGYVGRQALECVLNLAHPPCDGKKPDPGRLSIDVVDQQICESCHGTDCDMVLADNLQQTGRVAEIQTIGRNLLHPELIRKWTAWAKENNPPVFIISLGGDSSDLDNIEAATRLTNRFLAENCPAPHIFVRTARQHGTGRWRDMQTRAAIAKDRSEKLPRIHSFGRISETSGLEDIRAQKTQVRAALSGWSWQQMNDACSPAKQDGQGFEEFARSIASLYKTCGDLLAKDDRLEVRWESNRFPALHAPVRVALLEDDKLREFYIGHLAAFAKWPNVVDAILGLNRHAASAGTTGLEIEPYLRGLATLIQTPQDAPGRHELKSLVVHGLTVCEFMSSAEAIIGLMRDYRKLNPNGLSLRDLSFLIKETEPDGEKEELKKIAASIRTAAERFPAMPLLDYLGQHEHTRWVAEKWLSGNTTHRCLVDNHDLPQIMKCLDHIQVACFAAYELIMSAKAFNFEKSPVAHA